MAQSPPSPQYLSLTFEHAPGIKTVWLNVLGLRSPHKLLALQYGMIEPNHAK